MTTEKLAGYKCFCCIAHEGFISFFLLWDLIKFTLAQVDGKVVKYKMFL